MTQPNSLPGVIQPNNILFRRSGSASNHDSTNHDSRRRHYDSYTCTVCRKTYSGRNARSIARRHLQDKHDIPLFMQARRNRWDRDPERRPSSPQSHNLPCDLNLIGERSLRKETDTESENRHAFQSKEGTTFSVLHDATDDRNMPTSLRLNGTLNLAKRNTYRVHPVLTCDFQSGAPTLDVSSTVLPSPQDPTHVPYASSASCTDQSVIPKTAYSSAAEHPALLPKLSTRMGLSILSAQSVPPGPQHSPLAKATGLKPNARDAVLTHTLDYEANEARTSTAFTTAQMPATPNHSAYRENEDHTPRRRLVDYESSTTVSSSPQHPNSAAVLGLIPKHPIPSTPGVSAIIGSDSPVNNRKGRQRHGLS